MTAKHDWTRSMLGSALALALTTTGLPAFAGSGTVQLERTSIGLAAGFDWGSGTFNIDGRDVPFTFTGYHVADIGVRVVDATGTVSNIEDVGDFEGTYTATEAGFAIGAGVSTIDLVNESGVKLRLSGINYGLGASLAAEGLTVELGDVPDLPEPEVAAAPPPAPDPEPAMPDPCEETVTFPGVMFEFDKAHLTPAGEEAVRVIANRLDECAEEQIVVDGYTDAVGADTYNLGLSQRRADSVKFQLSQEGLSLDRITAVGHGKANPVAPNDTQEGRAENRRAEISTP